MLGGRGLQSKAVRPLWRAIWAMGTNYCYGNGSSQTLGAVAIVAAILAGHNLSSTTYFSLSPPTDNCRIHRVYGQIRPR